MKNIRSILISFLVLYLVASGFSYDSKEYDRAQQYLKERGEVYFRFSIDKKSKINEITEMISIDNVIGTEIYAYANKNEFETFAKLNLYYEILTPPSRLIPNPPMSDYTKEQDFQDWNSYPTYQGFLNIMNRFESEYPELCKVVEIGTTIDNRKLIAIKISDNISKDEAEPRFWYSSSMHGDEITGYVTQLHLADYMLKNYPNDKQVKNLVENVEIWFMPLENPDGTYKGGNNTVWDATRGNARGVDLNRNYPKLPNGSGNFQQETKAMMAFYDKKEFVMSANYHGGAHYLNFPFDSWKSSTKKHADHDWWRYVCEAYKKFASYLPITHGGDWYVITGSRQDYMNYFQSCRELTVEISQSKTVSERELLGYWEKNYKGMLAYIEECLYGVNGIIEDGKSGDPLEGVKVFVENHDKDNSHVFSKGPHGDYYRPILAGTYDFTFSKDGYQSRTLNDVKVENKKTTKLNVRLWKDGSGFDDKITKTKYSNILITPNKTGVFIHRTNVDEKIKANVYNIHGKLLDSFFLIGHSTKWENKRKNKNFGPGYYLIQLVMNKNRHITEKVFISF